MLKPLLTRKYIFASVKRERYMHKVMDTMYTLYGAETYTLWAKKRSVASTVQVSREQLKHKLNNIKG